MSKTIVQRLAAMEQNLVSIWQQIGLGEPGGLPVPGDPPVQPGEGWTDFTPTANTRVAYVSAAGSDGSGQVYGPGGPALPADPFNPGSINAFLTISAARTALGNGDRWLLCRRGDTFNISTFQTGGFVSGTGSGPDATTYYLWGSYGSGARPVIQTTGNAISANVHPPSQFRNFAVVGLDFYCFQRDPHNASFAGWSGSDPGGFVTNAVHENLLLEDCRFRFYGNALNFENNAGGHLQNFKVRRCQFVDSYDISGHSQGIFCNGNTNWHNRNIIIEECLFDHNGWLELGRATSASSTTLTDTNALFQTWGITAGMTIRNTDDGAGSSGSIASVDSETQLTVTLSGGTANAWAVGDSYCIDTRGEQTGFNHNFYLQQFCQNVTVRNCIIARASSHGISSNVSGLLENNVLVHNSITIFCRANGCTVRGNVILEAKNIHGTNLAGPRGRGIVTGDRTTAQGYFGPLLIEDNIITQKIGTNPSFNPIQVGGNNGSNALNVTVRNNIIYQDPSDRQIFIGSTGLDASDSILVDGNRIQSTSGFRVWSNANPVPAQITYTNNRYLPSGTYRIGGSGSPSLNFTQWTAAKPSGSGETGASEVTISYADPTRSVGSYHGSLGQTATLKAFLATARQQHRQSWNTDYTAAALKAYLVAGFAEV